MLFIIFFCSIPEASLLDSGFSLEDFVDGFGSRVVDACSLSCLDDGVVFFMDESNELLAFVVGDLCVYFSHFESSSPYIYMIIITYLKSTLRYDN